MNAAVVGAGMAGLAVTWYLRQKNIAVTLFDPMGIGGGASGISTGLLHDSPGKWAQKSWQADEAMEGAKELLKVSEASLGSPVALRSGLLRIAVTDQQKADFRGKGIWWSEEEVLEVVPKAIRAPGVFVPEGITVFSKRYLEGLWSGCAGAKLERQTISDLNELSSFDFAVLAAGAETLQFNACKELPLKCNIGQSLLCEWRDPVPFSLLSQGHLSPTEFPELCQIGSTYEHGSAPEKEKALELLEKIAQFYPPAKDFKVVEIRSGVRIAPIEGHIPVHTQVAPKTWALTGFGSRGLLYHGYLAKKIVNEILTSL